MSRVCAVMQTLLQSADVPSVSQRRNPLLVLESFEMNCASSCHRQSVMSKGLSQLLSHALTHLNWTAAIPPATDIESCLALLHHKVWSI